MRGGRHLFPLVLLALLRGLCHGREPSPGAVTCGSVLKLLNTRHSVRLHSHEVKYGSGSGQQSVTGVEASDDANSYWRIRGKSDGSCQRGTPVKCGQAIRLTHVNTGKNLHTHHFPSPLSNNQARELPRPHVPGPAPRVTQAKMKTVLMVAEKPSLAQSIAKILSRGNMSSRKGLNGACSVHEYTGSFIGQSAHFKMTSVCGHVMTLDFIGKYNSWDKVDPAELFSKAPTEKKEANPKLTMVKFLQVLDAVLPVMNKPRGTERSIYRAKFSSITDTDICNAMNHLGEPNRNEALSVDARQELDLRIGCAFTRFQTKYFQGKYGNLDSSLISFGPCQTPTLGFCVERHDKIQSFKPETYWVLQAKVNPEKESSLTLDWDRVRVFDREVAQMFLNITKMSKEARVESVSKKEKVKQRPLALNTVEMLRVASAALGMGPQHAMQIAERLYTQGYISYPRTETTHYPENFDLKGCLRQQANNPYWAETVNALLSEGINHPRKGHDAGDHPPITPMRAATEAELGGDGWRLYEYITRHFIATVSADCKYLQTTISFSIGPERFTSVGKVVTSPGFTEIMPWHSIPLEESLPRCEKGDLFPIGEIKLLEKQTSPPDYLTEAELITLMEKHGIGTDASIPVHINNICQRNYVTVESGRRLKPTNLGIVLVHGYYKIDAELVLPTIRSAVEKQLNLIALGKANYHQVLEHTLDIFKRKFHYFVDSIAGMDELMEVSFSPLAATGKPLSRCGKCHRFMKYIQAKPSRLHCSHCDDTYSLPQNGTIKLYKELRCPLDDFELVLWSSGSRGKSYPLCPYCYNHPPFRDMKKGMGCNECTHPTCQHSLSMLGIGQCVECENGVLVLDSTSGPKWKMACNKCNVIVHFFENAHKVRVSPETCDLCEAGLVDVDFNKAKSPLPGDETQHSGCVFCDPVFQDLVELKHAAMRHPMHRGGQGKRQGRGRGKSRRPGGRVNPKKPKDKMAALAAYFV
ncbi:DNA topoisomerase 3-beta-1 isoform X2 [Neopelma chrysocephalum]|uniref:DNA topoisomerase 3-beta-1 isoform X2 n=1 Tax=Neopelma chrysocephalum TaxID=114329 RepID=UPI000FCCE276|nr:DNA topoisomerase 3-beta-1 isoform X2 [Neopelma chrysocephalum]